jgi:hypothetical protein
MTNTKEFEAACNGEIDLIPSVEVGEDLVAELDDWAEIGWLLLECGCLVGPHGMPLHGDPREHLLAQREGATEH